MGKFAAETKIAQDAPDYKVDHGAISDYHRNAGLGAEKMINDHVAKFTIPKEKQIATKAHPLYKVMNDHFAAAGKHYDIHKSKSGI